MKRILAAGFLFVLPTLSLLAASCHRDSQGASDGGGGGGGRRGGGEGGVAFAVDLLKLEKKKLDYTVTAPGTIEAFERVQVTSRVAGAVDRVAFTEGQIIKKDQVLVVIDSQRFQLSVNSSKAALQKAEAAQKETEAMVTRREGAMTDHPGLIPGEELESYRTKSLTAKADTAVAAEALKVAELNLRDSAVRAPIEGVIQTRTVETGQYVQSGYVMATLLRSDPMLLRFEVEPQEAPRLKPDMVARFTLRETQRTYDAKITLVAGSADTTTHMVGVTGQVVDTDHKYWLRPGSFCDVTVDIGAPRDAVVVPRVAVRPTDHGYVSYVVENDVVSERQVTLGMTTKDGWVEVRSGLEPDEWIVVRGGEALSPGARVRGNRLTSMDASAPSSTPPPRGAPEPGMERPGSDGALRGDGGRGGGGDAGRRRKGEP